MRRLILLPLLLILSACGYEHPTMVGSGYAHHGDDAYNAPPGAPAESLGYTYTAEENLKQQALWRSIAKDLVVKMEAAGVQPRMVYIEPLPVSNAFNNSFDYALREELRSRGYTLVAAPAQYMHLRYEAFREGGEKIVRREIYNEGKDIYTKAYDPKKAEAFVFVLTVMQKGKVVGNVKTGRTMPAYGYVAGEGVRPVPDTFTQRLKENFKKKETSNEKKPEKK